MADRPTLLGPRTLVRCQTGAVEFGVLSDHVDRIALAGGHHTAAPDWLHEPFGGPAAADLAGSTVVALRGQPPRAIRVDRVLGEVKVRPAALLPVPRWLFRRSARWFAAAAVVGDRLLPVFWPGRLRDEPAPSYVSLPPPLVAHGGGRAGRDRLVLCSLSLPEPGRRPVSVGLGPRDVLEVTEPGAPSALPGMPEPIGSACEWRERLLPLVDLAAYLGLPGLAPDAPARMIVACLPGQREPFGFRTAAVRLPRLPVAHEAVQRPLAVRWEHVRGAVELRDETVVFPDFAPLAAGAAPDRPPSAGLALPFAEPPLAGAVGEQCERPTAIQ